MQDITRAAEFIREGKLVAFPTETVYGLGANALDEQAVASIFAAKNRPQFNPLITHVKDISQAFDYGVQDVRAEKLAAAFWPGALTMVLPRKKDCALSWLVSAGLDCVGVRAPNHPMAQALLHATNLPIAAPSANRSGRISPTLAQHVREELGDDVAMILDGGACALGIESTVLDLTGEVPAILRPGTITQQMIEAVIGNISTTHANKIIAPGMMESHYAPNATLRLNALEAEAGEVLLAFGQAKGALNLSPRGDVSEAAANLFAMLRALDAQGVKTIAVSPIVEEGLGVAINDRLKRAAAPRSS